MREKIMCKAVFLTSSPDASYQVDGTWVTGPFTEKTDFWSVFGKPAP